MKQSAQERPIPSIQRKAAIANGAAIDHTGMVRVEPILNFDLDRTIFSTLKGTLPRFVIRTRIAKEAHWNSIASRSVEDAYQDARKRFPLPKVDHTLMRFMVEECDFDVEHADGSFLDHLYFGFEYCVQHYPQHSPIVMLLHSILGTGTNTFAMEASKIPTLRALMSEFEWTHVEAFPSILRLLYDSPLMDALRANRLRLDKLESIQFNRVIDNELLSMDAEDFWTQLNFQLIHLVDFLPVSNWAVHSGDAAFIVFRNLFDLLEKSGHLETKLDYTRASQGRELVDEKLSIPGWLTTLIPAGVSQKMAAKSVRKFSEQIGHSMEFELIWKS